MNCFMIEAEIASNLSCMPASSARQRSGFLHVCGVRIALPRPSQALLVETKDNLP